MENTKIEWASHTFNPWMGCTKVSPGCANCYAETLMDTRYGKVKWGNGKPRVRTAPANWRKPLQWNRQVMKLCDKCGTRFPLVHQANAASSRCSCGGILSIERPRVFCASLADVFDDEVEIAWLHDLLALIDQCPNLDWLLLTKRPENIVRRMQEAMNWNFDLARTFAEHMTNVWLGTSAENQKYWNERVPKLLDIPAAVHFVSAEPLLGPIVMGRHRPDWLIVGGESGPGSRPLEHGWATSLRDESARCGVDFHFKQWGGTDKKATGRLLDGRTWDELPTPRRNPEF